jgi:hypothetical protein
MQVSWWSRLVGKTWLKVPKPVHNVNERGACLFEHAVRSIENDIAQNWRFGYIYDLIVIDVAGAFLQRSPNDSL